MALRGIVRLNSSLTSAAQDDWAPVIYPFQGQRTLGELLTTALRSIGPAVVAVLDRPSGRFVITTDSAVKATLRGLAPSQAAVCEPVLVFGQTASQWTLVSDAWSYGNSALPTMCLPQLTKRTVGAFVDKALGLDAYGFALVDQDNVQVKLWQDWNLDAAAALAAITPSGMTVCGEFQAEQTILPFEGGAV